MNRRSKVLVTGATGFVGTALVERLLADGLAVRASARRPVERAGSVEFVAVDEIGPTTDWSRACEGVDVVVHTAARVHVTRDRAVDPLAEFRRVNTAGTCNLARQATAAGVRRFVFLSSIKVNGESTVPGRPYTPDDEPNPLDPYGVSKRDAEQEIGRLAKQTGLDAVIIRPVLVYGPGVRGNFGSLLGWLNAGVPLPLGAIHNQRSLVAVGNLVDLIVTCLDHAAAANQTFLVSDGEDMSTTVLLRRTAAAMGRRARLLPVPAAVLHAAARAVGRADLAQRLCGSLQVDIGKTRSRLGWAPPIGIDEALEGTARAFMAARK